MELFLLEPEVSGGHGDKTVYGDQNDIENKGVSGKVIYLHYEFDGWLGDELLESTPCFIISENLEKVFSKALPNDYLTEDCLISVSEEFEDIFSNKILPKFFRFIPVGTVYIENNKYHDWSGHNFCISQKGELVVTEKALLLLEQYSIEHCDIQTLTN